MPKQTPKEIMDKIRKVSALTSSSNVNEAAAAAAVLQRMLQKHQLAMSDVEAGSIGEDVVESTIESGYMRIPAWEAALVHSVVGPFEAQLLTTEGGGARARFKIIAHQSDAAFIVWLFEKLKSCVVSAAKANAQRYIKSYRTKAFSNFVVGASVMIRQRLEEANRAPEAESTHALVILKSAAVKAYCKDHYSDTPTKRRRGSKVGYGFREGAEYGQSVSLSRPIEMHNGAVAAMQLEFQS